MIVWTQIIPPGSLYKHVFELPEIPAPMPAEVNRNAPKSELKAVKKYLETMDTKTKAGCVYGEGGYRAWHGDGKSQSLSKTGIAFETKTIYTSGQPRAYKTIVTLKRDNVPFVTYETSTWSRDGTAIVDEMIKAIKV